MTVIMMRHITLQCYNGTQQLSESKNKNRKQEVVTAGAAAH